MKTVFLFAGQGSQFYGMARPLFAENAVFREALRDLDDIARGLVGQSIVDAIYDPRRSGTEPFDRTLLTHPAVFMIEVALARALEREGVVPDLIVGSSLGELAALVVARAISAEDALEACLAQAELLESRCAAGGMIAVLDDPRIFDELAWLREGSTLAGINLARHFVIAAPAARCDAILARCAEEQVICQRIPVRVAFHSSAMDPARDEFLARVAKTPFAPPAIPILSSARARQVDRATPELLWEVARAPIRFRDVLALIAEELPCRFVDLSPGATLSTFVKHRFPAGTRLVNLPIVTPFRSDLENFARVVAEHRGSRPTP